MGNTLPPSETSSEILNKYWEPMSSGLYRNKTTQEVIRQKKMTFGSEDEMKQVFNNLLKRMNDNHPSVIKIVYVRKMTESSRLCECGKNFVILVYIEHVQNKLKRLVQGKDRLVQNIGHIYDHKCVCMHMLKASQYLKQRYGPFRVTQNNTWISVPRVLLESNLIQQNILPPGNKCDYAQSIRLKLWISSNIQQNIPDDRCSEKQMVFSIVQFIQRLFVTTRLCHCYTEPYVLDKYLNTCRLNELALKIMQDHQIQSETSKLTKPFQNIQVMNKQAVQFQRTLRSFSSNIPGHHSSQPHNSHHIISQNSQLSPQRKYASIEYVRKQTFEHCSAVSDNKVSTTPQAINQMNHFFSPSVKPLFIKSQPPQNLFLQHAKTYQKPAKNDHSLNKNQYNPIIKFQLPSLTYQTQKHPLNFVKSKQTQLLNLKLKYLNSDQKFQSPSFVDQIPLLRDIVMKDDEISKVSKINFKEDQNMRHLDISRDKATNPTDRSKIDISFKSEEKKQLQGISSSRQKISVIPISLDSRNEAAESFKPILQSQGHIDQLTCTPVSGQLQIPEIKDSSIIIQEKSKKESASSSKSERNHITYQINLVTSKNKEEIGKFVPRKLSSDSQEQQLAVKKVQKHGDNHAQKQRSSPQVNKIQNLAIITPNNDMEGLRKSMNIGSRHNLMLDLKQIFAGQSKQLTEQKMSKPQTDKITFEIGSAKQMEGNYPTMKNLQNHQQKNILKLQNCLFVQNETKTLQKGTKNQIIDKEQIIIVPQTKPINLDSYHLSRQLSFISNKKSSNKSLAQNKKPQNHQLSSNPANSPTQISTQQLDHIFSYNMSSRIQMQNEEPLNVQKVTEEDYKIKVITQEDPKVKFIKGSEREKMHHKKMSNPTFDKQYMKTRALKQEFSQLLGQPKENSFKALTESKDILIALDQNQSQQAYNIQNSSQYNTIQHQSKCHTQHQNLAGFQPTHTPLHGKEHGIKIKWRKSFSKQELKKEIPEKKSGPNTPPNQQALTLTSSGYEDNSIKQKVRSKKAQFAELKNQMNSLLF